MNSIAKMFFIGGIALLLGVGGTYYYLKPAQTIPTIAEPIIGKETTTSIPTTQIQTTNTETPMETQVKTTPSSTQTIATTTDPLAGLGSNKYADGILPLGDGKYTTTGPKKGYIYLCNANINSQGGGAEGVTDWISTSTWDLNKKVFVQGAVSWTGASYLATIEGATRVIKTNDLPVGMTTGIFPIQSTDPAYQADRNPNSIKAQNLTFNLPANPAIATQPSCIGGEVGVMTNGVMLFDGFDAENRDAVAHEVQDSCDGHPQEADEYHYHGPSQCFANPSVTTVIGFAFDGFPITGAKISDNRFLTTSDLDECHGITSPILLDGKTTTIYHYVMTEDFPYSVSCFRGKPAFTGPSVPVNQTGNNQLSGGTQNNQQNGAPQPPAEATAACSGKSAGASCSFTTPQGNTLSGACQTPPGQSLACLPQ